MPWLPAFRTRYRPLFTVAAATLIVMVSAALLYKIGMDRLEGQERGFWQALAFAAETITTTGYGSDTSWRSPAMILFVIALQLFGVMLVYMVIPLVLVPVLEQRFEAKLPRRADDLRDHVILVRHGPAIESLLEELDRAQVPSVIVETDEAVARSLLADERRTIIAARTVDALENVALTRARALVANDTDEENAGIILAARQLGYDGEILSLVEAPAHRRPMQLVGASVVLEPKVMLAATLAARASHQLAPRVHGMQQIGDRLQVAEVRVETDSAIAGQTLAQAAIGERTGCTVVGQWIGGSLSSLPGPEARIAHRGILVAVGEEAALNRLAVLATAGNRAPRTGPIVVAGYGEVGRKVVQLLREVGEPVLAIDRQAHEGVDLVRDVLDPSIPQAARLAEARSMVIALDTDSATVFATVLMREQAPEISIAARVNEAENVERIHAAGADFALSISQVAGRLLAHHLLGQDGVEIESTLRVARISTAPLVGRRLADLDLGRCSLAAVERDDLTLVRIAPAFVFAEDDAIFLCGAADDLSRWQQVQRKNRRPHHAPLGVSESQV